MQGGCEVGLEDLYLGMLAFVCGMLAFVCGMIVEARYKFAIRWWDANLVRLHSYYDPPDDSQEK